MNLRGGSDSSPTTVDRETDDVLWRKWLAAWLGAVALALANATVREVGYVAAVGQQAAHQIASIVLILLLGGYVALLERRWPIPSTRQALAIGLSWAAATVAFEFVLGLATGLSLAEILANYNLAEGKLWALVPLAIAFLPAAARTLRMGRAGGR